ncbi:Cutinase [Fusarium keratoplasticum]|uniref:Cutinase n=1 Tax=Fusarium keratoplasticum TaxID=1328300 RepID=A0ACC0QUP1_9HYPO|nr:Cutinase [Fusarium keratoplasticum]KAI8666200.1 Cutinase [Fusarium keratoplasticum]KAI8667905.1 Cutinase [Fusarium keratoplasticum]
MKTTVALPLVLAATAQGHSARDTDCKDVHIFLAKGNNEPYPGRQGKLAGAICSGLDSCDYEDIQFYNPLEAPYCGSVFEGAKNGIQQITAYNKKCPDSKLVVSGYSQGGHVVGDILGGGGGVFFQDCVQEPNKGLDPKTRPANKIVAAMIFGDTRHTANQPYNVLSGAGKDGLFPRPGDQLANLAKYGDVLHNYCVDTDPICAQGDVVETHLNYFDVFTDDVAGWVKERVNAAEDDGKSSSTTASTKTRATTTTTSKSETTTDHTTKTSTKDSKTTTKASTESEETSSATKTKTESDAETTTTEDATSTAKTSTTKASTVEPSSADSSGSETAAASSSNDAATPSAADNAAGSTAAHIGGILMGLAAALAI